MGKVKNKVTVFIRKADGDLDSVIMSKSKRDLLIEKGELVKVETIPGKKSNLFEFVKK